MTKPRTCPKDSLGLINALSGFRLWSLDTPHTLDEVLVPGYFAKDQAVRSGDWILGNVASADGSTFEPVILVVTLGYDTSLPGGAMVEAEVVVLARPRPVTMKVAA